MKNNLLKYSILITRLMQISYCLFGMIYTYLIIEYLIIGDQSLLLQQATIDWLFIEMPDQSLSTNHPMNVVPLLIQFLLELVLYILALQSLISIITSIKSIKTFELATTKHFKRIAIYMLIAFVVTLFEFSYMDSSFTLTLQAEFQLVLFAMLSLIFREVFKEGHRLWKENQLTI